MNPVFPHRSTQSTEFPINVPLNTFSTCLKTVELGFYSAKIICKVMSEVIEILKRIESKLDEMDEKIEKDSEA